MYRIVVFRSLWPIRIIIVRASYPATPDAHRTWAVGYAIRGLRSFETQIKERLMSVKGLPVSGLKAALGKIPAAAGPEGTANLACNSAHRQTAMAKARRRLMIRAHSDNRPLRKRNMKSPLASRVD